VTITYQTDSKVCALSLTATSIITTTTSENISTGGNFITKSSFDVFARKGIGGFGELLSRNDLFFRAAVDGVVNFGGLFFDLPSVYDIIFNATFDNITADVTLDNLRITG
jgi:hypothetical protein